jgi:hypothetical protein
MVHVASVVHAISVPSAIWRADVAGEGGGGDMTAEELTIFESVARLGQIQDILPIFVIDYEIIVSVSRPGS